MITLSKRWEIVCFLFSGLVVVYTLRVNMSVAVKSLSDEFNWSESDEGLALSAFYWGYTIGQIPGARLANRWGAKFVFGLSILVPSLLTLLVPVSIKTDYGLCLFLRALIGFTEAASFPCTYHIISKWVVPEEKTSMITGSTNYIYMFICIKIKIIYSYINKYKIMLY